MRAVVVLVAVGAALAGANTLVAQTAPKKSTAQGASPRTAWGDPDLQGTWTNETITPFERPKNLADKTFLTEQEAAAIERQAAAQRENADGVSRPGDVGNYNQFWF